MLTLTQCRHYVQARCDSVLSRSVRQDRPCAQQSSELARVQALNEDLMRDKANILQVFNSLPRSIEQQWQSAMPAHKHSWLIPRATVFCF